MSFFKIRENVEKIGAREIVPLWEYDIEAPTAQSRLADSHFPEIEPLFSRLLVTNPLTDVLADGGAIGGTGFIVSDKLKNLLETFRLGKHRFYSLETYEYNSNKKLNVLYYWLQIISTNYYDWIDYNKSEFFIFDNFEEEFVNKIEIKSPGGLIEAIDSTFETDNSIVYTKLNFTKNYANLDLFYMDGISDKLFNYPIVSARLKEVVDQKNIIGFEFKKVEIYLNYI